MQPQQQMQQQEQTQPTQTQRAPENGYTSPVTTLVDVHRGKQIRLQVKVAVPIEDHPNYNFVGKLLGPKGNSLKWLQEQTQTKMAILGKGSMRNKEKENELRQLGDAKHSHLNEDLHVEITAFAPAPEAYHRISNALYEIKRFLVPDYYDEIRKQQLRELGVITDADLPPFPPPPAVPGPGLGPRSGTLPPQMLSSSSSSSSSSSQQNHQSQSPIDSMGSGAFNHPLISSHGNHHNAAAAVTDECSPSPHPSSPPNNCNNGHQKKNYTPTSELSPMMLAINTINDSQHLICSSNKSNKSNHHNNNGFGGDHPHHPHHHHQHHSRASEQSMIIRAPSLPLATPPHSFAWSPASASASLASYQCNSDNSLHRQHQRSQQQRQQHHNPNHHHHHHQSLLGAGISKSTASRSSSLSAAAAAVNNVNRHHPYF